jgi:hypothetical protein
MRQLLRSWSDNMRRKSLFGSLAVVALAMAALPGSAAAESLTRSGCWTAHLDTGAWRKMCFLASGRVKMNNRNQTSDGKAWSTCEWAGLYAQTDSTVTVAFAPGSGKCSNGPSSPQWAATCSFSGDDLDCKGSAIVDGKIYEVTLTFK